MNPPLSGPALSPDGRFFWDGSRWVPIAGPRKSRLDRWLRIGIPGLPWLLLLAFTAISPTYALPMAKNLGGIIAFGFVGVCSAIAWLIYPPVASISNGVVRGVATAAWMTVFTLPGLVIVLLGPAAFAIASNPSLHP